MRKTNSCRCLLLLQSTEITVISPDFPPEYPREKKGYFIKNNMMMVKIKMIQQHYYLLLASPWRTKNHVYKTAVIHGFRTGAILLVLSNSTSRLSSHTPIIVIQFLGRSNFIFLITPDILSPSSHQCYFSYFCVSHLSTYFQSHTVSHFTFILFQLYIQSNVC